MKKFILYAVLIICILPSLTGCALILEFLGLGGKKIDLSVSISFNTEKTDVVVTITNDGKADIVDLKYLIVLSADTSISLADQTIYTGWIDVDAKDTVTVNKTIASDFDFSGISEGDYYIGVIVDPDNTLEESSTEKRASTSETYTYPPEDGEVATVATPVFSYPTGYYTDGFYVDLTCATAGASIYYTKEMLGEFILYEQPLEISTHTTIIAKATKEGMTDSPFRRIDYAIIPDDTGNLIGNGDFTLGRTLWRLDIDKNSTAQASIDFSTQEAEVTQTSPGSETYMISLKYVPTVLIENSRIYTLIFDAKASQNRRIIVNIGEFGRDLNSNGNLWDSYLRKEYDLTTGWQTFTIEFGMLNPTDDASKVEFQLGEYSGNVTIDNISLTARDSIQIDASIVPDPGLLEAIAYQAGTEVNNLWESHLLGITYLSGGNRDINDLTGVSMLKNCTNLDVWGNNISDISPLLEMEWLTELWLMGNPLNYTALSILTKDNFPNLSFLALSNSEAQNLVLANIITLFEGLKPLTGIGLEDFGMTDADFTMVYNTLIDPAELGWLGLAGNDLQDQSVELIGNCLQLFWLRLSNNPITDLSGLTGLTKMKKLRINGTFITNLQPLKDLYDSGAFRPVGESNINVKGCGLELWPGTNNRAVIDFLVSKGIPVDWQDGNVILHP